eukprot:6832586-Karenia_brevis.AAC.1
MDNPFEGTSIGAPCTDTPTTTLLALLLHSCRTMIPEDNTGHIRPVMMSTQMTIPAFCLL